MIRPWGLVTWILAPAFPVPEIVASPSVTGFTVGVADFSCGVSAPLSWGFWVPASGCCLSFSLSCLAATNVFNDVGVLFFSVCVTTTL